MTRRRIAMLAAALMASAMESSSTGTLSKAHSEGETDAHKDNSNDDENTDTVETSQQKDESAHQNVINDNADKPSGSEENDMTETLDDERIRDTEKPRIKRDPRPVSEQVKAYYEHISRGSDESEKQSGNVGSSETKEEQSDTNSVQADTEGLGNKSSQSGETISADKRPVVAALEGESNHVNVNDETENRNPEHHDTDAVNSVAPNESTNTENGKIQTKTSADPKQKISSGDRSNEGTAEEEMNAGEPDDELNAEDPSTDEALDTTSSVDNNIQDYGSSMSESTSQIDLPGEYVDDVAPRTRQRSEVHDDTERAEQEPISYAPKDDSTSSIIDDKDVRTQNETIPVDSPEPRTEEDTAEAVDEAMGKSGERLADEMTPSDEEILPERDTCDNETVAQTAGAPPKDAATDSESMSNSTFPTTDETAAKSSIGKETRDDINIDEEVIDFDIIDGKIKESPEDKAGTDTINNLKPSNNAPPNDKEGITVQKPKVAEYFDEDVIDFDIIDSFNDGSSPGQVADARSDTPVTEKVVSDSNNYKRSQVEPNETENDVAQQNASVESPPSKGSIAELFDKVSKKEAVDFSSTSYIRPAKSATAPENTMDSKVTQNDPLVSSIQEERASSFEGQSADSPQEYSAGWGVRPETAPRATRSSLPEYLTKSLYAMTGEEDRRDQTQTKSDSINQQVLDGVDDSGADSQDSTDDTRQKSASPDEASVDGGSVSTESKSVNSQFVDGLDDIDKFFESIDPPDELDVGAAGSSIQEVLVGQSVKIVLNRVKLGFRFLRKRFGKVKARLDKYVSRRTTQDGEVALITREDIKSTVDSLKHLGKKTLRAIKDLTDDLFADEDEGDVYDIDNGLDQVRAKIDSLRREQRRIEVPQRPANNNQGPP